MENNDELKEIDIKSRMCYYFDDIMRVGDFDLIIFYEKNSYENSYENILTYDISHKIFMGAKLFRI